MSQAAIDVLDDRLEGLMDRLKQVERWCAQKPEVALDLRFALMDEQLKTLETRLGIASCPSAVHSAAIGALYLPLGRLLHPPGRAGRCQTHKTALGCM